MKYIKLFEAFESGKLSKTLGYISNDGKKFLLEKLRNLCNGMDFPFSKLNDDLFEYLPYKKALKVKYVESTEPCKSTSISQFGRVHGIEDEKCEGGKIKRRWGASTRIVSCQSCGGTGIEQPKSDVKILKFWFTKDGEYVATSGVDGIIRKNAYKALKGSYDRTLENYIIGREPMISSLEIGDIVYARINYNQPEQICYVFKEGPRTYLIQDLCNGSKPTTDTKSLAPFAWDITNGDFKWIKRATLKDSKKPVDSEEEEDLFSWNAPVSFNYNGVTIGRGTDLERQIQNAHFAIVFDLGKLKKSEFTKVKDIKNVRDEIKSGSVLTTSNENIKKANIDRYLNEISKRSDIISDITNLNKVTKRLIGYQNVYFLMKSVNRFTYTFGQIIDYYLAIMKSTSDGERERLIGNLISSIKDEYTSISRKSSVINNNIKAVKLHCVNKNLKEELSIIEGLERLSKKIYTKITSINFECIEDLEIAKNKLDSIKSISSHDRYYISKCDTFLDSIDSSTPERSINNLVNSSYIQNYKENILLGIDQLIMIVDKI